MKVASKKNGVVKLKNGTEEPPYLVEATMAPIHHLWKSGFSGIATISDLVQICRNDPSYRKFGKNEETLKKFHLLQADGRPHDSIRNIVLSAFSGEGLELKFTSPIAE